MSGHAEWCGVEFDKPCDCGGNGGACPACGSVDPCGFASDGTPLICAVAQ